MAEGKEKPKMASLLPGMAPESVNLDVALLLLSLPKTLGKHPETNDEIQVASGRFGPYIKCGTESRSIPADESPFGITIERAVEILKQPRTRGRASSQPKVLREVGKHPSTNAPLVIKSGRYGPYVTDGELNASLPQGMQPEALTVEEAVGLLEARAAKAPTKKRGGRKAGGKAAAAKKPAGDDASKPKAKRSRKKAETE
jgi:DNA topoisomerase-1